MRVTSGGGGWEWLPPVVGECDQPGWVAVLTSGGGG